MYKKFTELLFRRHSHAWSNFHLKMKLTAILIVVAVIQLKAETFAQKISVNVNNARFSEVIAELRKQTDYDFLYNNEVIKNVKPVTLRIKNANLREVLDRCFKDQPVSYSISNKTVLIMARPAPQPENNNNDLREQRLRISGTVTDETNTEPLIGASVVVEGTAIGVSTDEKGFFSLDVPGSNAVLVVSYVGFQPQKVTVGNQTTLQIKLVRTDAKLDAVVVVGYGTRTKGAITGAISTVKSDVFESRPLNNSYDALQGTIPGLTITKASGQPGSTTYGFQVRGYSSVNGNAPLVLIDGIPGDINTINTNDIAEVTVLKDAAAAIYGARAANGVIIVTTKRGKKGPPVVTYTANVGYKTPTYLRKMQNTMEFARFMDEGLRNVGINGFSQEVFDKIAANAPPDPTGWNYGVTNYPGFYGYTDWNKVIYKNSTQQLHNINVSGGGENNSYLLSAGYNRDNGIVRFGENKSNGYNLRLNYDLRFNDHFAVETRSYFDNRAVVTPTLLGSALTNVTRQFPYQPVYNKVGQFYGYQGYEGPAQYLEEGGRQLSNVSRFGANVKIDYTVIPGLKLTGQAAVRMDYQNGSTINRTITRHNWEGGIQDVRNTPNSANYSNDKLLNKLYQAYLDYNKKFGQDHAINFTGGASLEQTRSEGQSTNGYNFISNDIFTLNLADRTKAAYANFTGYLNNQALGSYFGRLSYTFREKLIVDFTARADGSSKFSPEKRWSAVFPSAAVAYNLSEERFIKRMNVFDLLKLRLSYGKMGNQDIGGLGLYDYIPLITINGNYPIGSPNAGLPGANANPASSTRTWETIETRNIGIDLAALRSRLSFSFDYYNKINNDMLVNVAVPALYGATPPSTNQGKLDTKGFEMMITWKDQVNDFRYSVSLQLSDSKNKLVELRNTDNYGEGLNQFRQGYPIYSYFGYVYEGIIKTEQQLNDYKKLQGIPSRISIGDVMYKDVDGDGKLTAFGDKTKGLSGDMVYLGNLTPRYTYSANFSAGYKNFDLQIFLQGVGKRNVIYEGAINQPNTFFWPSLEYFYGKTWSPERPDAQYPRYLPGNLGYDDVRNYNYRASALTLQNVAYLRFKVITLGYNIPGSILKKAGIKSARIYFSGQDLFTLSKGTLGGNFDPEDGYRNEGTYPFNKVYSLGLNVKF
ncbi:TonB-dependent receptor [Chitinophaga filiformis]|uniref:TonB-linked outer membrane protein, SusC/RagA family n=1 Tax=Chitinophaga filiformis TaxID=104663 RepID=A0A1G8BRB5_CHIFI|nr:TonB-dependent receptor [Chitinophaga filiformis]SDH35681.1 TonB-linked outer membrane protein, SusC/RagA family [Chitinophaga filiformis]